MRIKKLGHGEAYAVKMADNCHAMFDTVINHYDMGDVVELRTHGYVSGALYGDKAVEFLKLWEIEQCK